ncbi:MAG: hypothetical protein HRT89_10890 [Lentisphaeria bacterium]|nr:sialate O-acetylesterase [Lentisphaeria bacterium]NQZ68561.1 hypothetical protein [Lentisphaeria bacterium]
MNQTTLSDWLIIINGESNSGGCELNTMLTAAELEPYESVQVLNNENLEFEPMQIGVNNLMGHIGIDPALHHGFELELANRADQMPEGSAPVHLVKTGHGGSTIGQWETPDIYYQIFLQRINAAKELLEDKPIKPALFFSLGINDSNCETEISIWIPKIKAHFTAMRSELGEETPIIMTKFMEYHAHYNDAIDQICSEDPNTCSVNTLDATLLDINHWDYEGLKLVSGRLIDALLK